SDGSNPVSFSPPGPIHIVPVVSSGTDDSTQGLAMLSDVEGLRLIQTSGSPSAADNRVPFVATWSTPDLKDHLSPVFVAPVQIEKAVTVHRVQFYTYSRHTEAQNKRLEIYSGTGPDSAGTLIQRVNLLMGASP